VETPHETNRARSATLGAVLPFRAHIASRRPASRPRTGTGPGPSSVCYVRGGGPECRPICLDAIVDFSLPDEEDRRRLWDKHLSAGVPRHDDVDLTFLARSFKLSGGNISNIAFSAAYLAAAEDRAVAMPDLVRATEREYRKLGHLCLETEFGPWYRYLSVFDGVVA
jgi:hypothetical protein